MFNCEEQTEGRGRREEGGKGRSRRRKEGEERREKRGGADGGKREKRRRRKGETRGGRKGEEQTEGRGRREEVGKGRSGRRKGENQRSHLVRRDLPLLLQHHDRQVRVPLEDLARGGDAHDAAAHHRDVKLHVQRTRRQRTWSEGPHMAQTITAPR